MINHYDMIINSSKSNEDTNHCRRYPSSSLSNYDESTSCASTSSIFASSLNSVLFYNSQERYNNNNNYNKNNPEGIGNTGKRFESMNEYNYNMLHKINKRYKYWNEERIYYEKSKSFSDSIYTKESLCQKKQKKNNYINMYNEPFMNIHNSLSNDYNDIMKSTIKNDHDRKIRKNIKRQFYKFIKKVYKNILSQNRRNKLILNNIVQDNKWIINLENFVCFIPSFQRGFKLSLYLNKLIIYDYNKINICNNISPFRLFIKNNASKKYLQLCNKILNIYEYLYIRKILLKGNGKGKRKIILENLKNQIYNNQFYLIAYENMKNINFHIDLKNTRFTIHNKTTMDLINFSVELWNSFYSYLYVYTILPEVSSSSFCYLNSCINVDNFQKGLLLYNNILRNYISMCKNGKNENVPYLHRKGYSLDDTHINNDKNKKNNNNNNNNILIRDDNNYDNHNDIDNNIIKKEDSKTCSILKHHRNNTQTEYDKYEESDCCDNSYNKKSLIILDNNTTSKFSNNEQTNFSNIENEKKENDKLEDMVGNSNTLDYYVDKLFYYKNKINYKYLIINKFEFHTAGINISLKELNDKNYYFLAFVNNNLLFFLYFYSKYKTILDYVSNENVFNLTTNYIYPIEKVKF
ncbi:hypothetical protein PFFVO_01121, partial [Plasmodium falciparum Vietnam Oak-Knoll (FVO)]